MKATTKTLTASEFAAMAFERCKIEKSIFCRIVSIYHGTENGMAQKYRFVEYGSGKAAITVNGVKYTSFPAAAQREIVEAFKQEKFEKIVLYFGGQLKHTEYYLAGEFDKINNRRNELNRITSDNICSREIL